MDFENAGMDQQDIPTSKIDEALVKVRELELIHNDARNVKTEASNNLEAAKGDFITLLQAAGKTDWRVEGYTGFTMTSKYQFKVPDGPDNKEKLIDFLRSEKVAGLMGQDSRDIYLKYVSVSSQSLQPLINLLKDEAAKNGEDLQIPGLIPPMLKIGLRSLPKRK